MLSFFAAATGIRSAIWGFLPLLAAGIIAVMMWFSRRRVRPSTLVWAGFFAVFALFLAIWTFLGNCESVMRTYALCCVVVTAAGLAVLQRDRVTAWLFGEAADPRGAYGEDDAEDAGRPHVRGRHSQQAARAAASDAGPIAAPLQATGRMQPAPAPVPARPRPRPARGSRAAAFAWLRDALLLVVAAVATYFAQEHAYSDIWHLNSVYFVVNGILLILLLVVAAYFLGQRRGGAVVPVAVVFLIWGMVESFLSRFKATGLLPSDLLAIQTAGTVMANYQYTFTSGFYFAFVDLCFAFAALAYIVPVAGARVPRGRRVAGNLACAAAAIVVFVLGVTVPDYQEEFMFKVDYWRPDITAAQRGALITFVACCQDMAIERPEGYSDAQADELISRYAQAYRDALAAASAAGDTSAEDAQAQFGAQKPNVIAVMNETYADLSTLEQLHAGYAGTFVTTQLDGTLAHGMTNVSVYSGGTCNSEFEFLAGSSMAFIGSGLYPFQQFDFATVDTLPRLFAAQGYDTAAMHPNEPFNWNREVVYDQMGFQEVHFLGDFPQDAEWFHNGVADGVTYDKVLEVLAAHEAPTFVFDVTMQNHGGYEQGDIPAEWLTDYAPDVASGAQAASLNEYLSCIAKSDADLRDFIAKLAEFDEPTVLVFFGDHHPGVSDLYNDAFYPDEVDEDGAGTLEHYVRIHQTPYFFWANYDVAGAARESREQAEAAAGAEAAAQAAEAGEGEAGPVSSAWAWEAAGQDTSPGYMGAMLMELIGFPLTDYDQAKLAVRADVPALNVEGYQDARGAWWPWDDVDAPLYRTVVDYQTMHYRNVVERL